MINPYKKIITLIFVDTSIVFFASWIALSSRLEIFYQLNYIFFQFFLINIINLLICSAIFKTYKIILRNLGTDGIFKFFRMLLTVGIISFLIYVFIRLENFPRSMGVIYPFYLILFHITSRILINYILKNNFFISEKKINTGIISAEFDVSLFSFLESIKEIKIVSFFEIKRKNIGRYIGDIKVNYYKDIQKIISKKNVNNFILISKNIKKETLNEIIQVLTKSGVSLKIYDDINFEDKFRLPDIEELLNRKNIQYKNEFKYLKNKEILITGAGGSIGSELSQLVYLNKPKKLLLLDNTELNLFKIQNKLISLNKENPNLKTKLDFILGSITDKNKINEIFNKRKIDIVFHVAAYKHVELLQSNFTQALKNNFLGTINVAEVANKNSVEKFINVSTDKAVKPNNFMGLSKLMAEEYLDYLNKKFKTNKFISVRFGNVINSSGSVIPLFIEQIKNQNKVLVRGKKTTRFFMSISEAVYLILKASKLNKHSKYILDMGEPIRIYDLAKKIIKILGKKENEALAKNGVKVVFTRLKPGEKEHEELTTSKELIRLKDKLIAVNETRLFADKDLIKLKDELIKKKKNFQINNFKKLLN